MKIVSVDVRLVDEPAVTPPFRWRDGLPGSDGPRTGGWLVLTTDEGPRGYAYCRRGPLLVDMVDRRIRDELVGADPLRREWLWHRMWELDRIEEFPVYIQGVIDDALWDLAGKTAGLPVHEVIGSFRDAIPAYASTVTFGSVEEYLDVADQCLELGYPAIKLHAWGDVRKDAKLCAALREHVGDDVPLMYDGSAGFDLIDAVYLGRVLSEADYAWYEEPMREFSVTAYRRLAERVDVPLLVAETSDGAHMNTADYIASGCASAVRTGNAYKGGLTGALRIAHLADSYLLRAEVHGGGLPNTHLCMAIPNTTYYESLVDSNPVRRAPEVDAAGLVRAPTGPGMGYEQVWNAEEPPTSIAADVPRDR
ncbi:mandelate racemase [Longispora fulva]|uniref:L-alanine-DL-glutamate epimerase-like enolase superfamily enzyme n=1 Tax=Longispora fulva TaxID=619741 RepID=A0A8J7GEN1_9ACTN|nr:enolase C-terminal domain-like protein [Longispora fulva]MBG6136370.1 L-alanine-DL-glutamate epimerase-like enolase superfamily enzyme [Longispora fulva]GIG63456.1 mandelate racemase [Longispora fulva]